MEEPRFDPLDYISAFNRRRYWFIVPVVLAVLIGGLVVWLLPQSYRSTATIAVSAPKLAPNLLATASLNRAERMRAISQQLLSQPVLQRVATLEHLDKSSGSIDGAINQMRNRVGVAPAETITPASARTLSPEVKAQLDTYQLTYVDSSPADAQRILNRVIQVFVEENNKSREVRAQDTSEFIGAQLQASEERLNLLEAKLRDAKESHMGRLPEQTNANLQMVSALQRQLEANATSLRGEQDRLSMIERQIESLQRGPADGSAGSMASPGSADMRVLTLRNELATAQLTFTEKHPEVIRLKEELATAEREAAADRSRPMAERLPALQSNPEYRQLQKDRESAQLRIAGLQRQQSTINGDINRYQMRIETAPRVEQQMVSLQREYDLERAAYGDLTGKHQAAMLNEALQMKQGGEQFSVLMPANRPSEPFEPKPLRVMLMAIAAGLVLGAAGVMGREYLDRSVHDARGLRDEFEVPVLAEIPRINPVM